MEELLVRLRDPEEMTLEELEEMQETLEEQDDGLRTKITMAKDEKLKAELETERRQVQEAIVLAETRMEEIKSREQADPEEQSGLSAYREEGTQEQSGLSAYREEGAQERSGLSAYREEKVQEQKDQEQKDQEQSSLSVNQEDTARQEQKSGKDFFEECEHAYDEGGIAAVQKMFTEVSIEAEKGDAEALYRLSVISSWPSRLGTIKNRRLLHKAMEQGSSEAYYDMAEMLNNGYGVEQDVEKAIVYLEKAAELGSRHAILETARAYRSGEAPEHWMSSFPYRDAHKALKYYKYYLEKTESGTYEYISGLLSYVQSGIEAGEEEFKDVDRLKKLLSPLLEFSSYFAGSARNLIGDALCRGKRFREAVSYWLEAGNDEGIKRILEQYDNISNAGDGEALDRILNDKINDAGQDKNTREIKRMILKWKGDRCGKDDVEAFRYYCQAASLGERDGRDSILKKYMDSNFIDASTFFEECAEGGNMDAYKYLGDLYAVDRRGNTHDYKKAMEYYLQGAKGPMKDTCEKLAEEMKNLLRQENRYIRAIDCVSSAVPERKKEGLDMIKQLAEAGFPAAIEYLKEHKPE